VSFNSERSPQRSDRRTQDNGTWAYDGTTGSWFESVGGDGGNSGISLGATATRMHTYYSPAPDVNFDGNNPLAWTGWATPCSRSGEAAAFYVPIIADPAVAGSWFIGLQHVFRTQDDGGSKAYLDVHCNESSGISRCPAVTGSRSADPPVRARRGTWSGSGYGTDKSGSYVVWISRALQNPSTMWVGTRRGRLFVSKNADASDPTAVVFKRIDTRVAAQTLHQRRGDRSGKFKPCLRIVLRLQRLHPDHAGSRFRRAVPPRQRDWPPGPTSVSIWATCR